MTSLDTTRHAGPAAEPAHPLRAFLAEMLRHPRQMGTLWPSSRVLARAMVRRLPEDTGLPVLELGPGTGVVTEALLASGLPARRLVAVEKSSRLTEVLRRRFPGARVVTGDALELGDLLRGERFGAVVSSLPLKVFSTTEVARLAESIYGVLHPEGRWIQYTYQVFDGHLPTDAFERVGARLVLRNLPPALVCEYQPRAAALEPARRPATTP